MELYIHVPFCRSKCRYCDFASYPRQEAHMARYCQSLIHEMGLYGPYEGDLSTLFIGGGTPSLLPPEWMNKVLAAVERHFTFESAMEFTCEANPGTLTPGFLQVLKKHGCNRLSLGAQASQQRLLQALGRIHTWQEVEASVALARKAGFDNISLDLMFGLPGQTLKDWQETLERALALKPRHLSCYGLIIEEGTPFYEMERRGELALPDEETERAMYDMTLQTLTAAGLPPYEISNFAQPGYECRHNLGYWRRVPYLGLGAAAHSMLSCAKENGACLRRGNTPDLAAYMTGIEKGDPLYTEYAYISFEEAQLEKWMLGLRTTQGVEADPADMERYGKALKALEAQKLLEASNGYYRLTRKGMDVQNHILVKLMDC